MNLRHLWKRFSSDPFDRQAAVQASQIAQELAGGLWTASQASAWSMNLDEARGFFRALARPRVEMSLDRRHVAGEQRGRVQVLAVDETAERLLARLRESRIQRGRQAA